MAAAAAASPSLASGSNLLEVTPPDALRFSLALSDPKTTLKVTNVSSGKVAFKVKTTQPKRYYVRPNQGFMREDWREFLQLHRLHQLPCRELLMSAARGNRENNTDRFLVMSMPIDDETYDRLSRSTEREKGDELTRLWDSYQKKDGARKDRQGKKLAVVYEYPENLEEAISRMGELAHQPSLADSVESVRERLAHPEGFIPASSVPVVGEPSGPPEAIFADLQKTRKKYDDVVEYTVSLTAERDMLNAKVEEMERDIARLRNRGDRDSVRLKNPQPYDGKHGQQGYQLFHLLLCALVFFLLGKFLRLE